MSFINHNQILLQFSEENCFETYICFLILGISKERTYSEAHHEDALLPQPPQSNNPTSSENGTKHLLSPVSSVDSPSTAVNIGGVESNSGGDSSTMNETSLENQRIYEQSRPAIKVRE